MDGDFAVFQKKWLELHFLCRVFGPEYDQEVEIIVRALQRSPPTESGTQDPEQKHKNPT